MQLESEGFVADLMAANNVLAHVPEIEAFARGFKVLLKPRGVATFEFPHLASLLDLVQFDTIYHEHYSYLSLTFLGRLMADVGLEVFDIEKLLTHGGSLRVYVGHKGAHTVCESVAGVQAEEDARNMNQSGGYADMAAAVDRIVAEFCDFLSQAKAQGKTVAGYGAAAKGNTFLNVAGVDATDVAFVVDRNPSKQNMLLPGSHIPVLSPDEISAQRPDYLVILPWNIASEVMIQQAHIREWGGQFVTAIPALRIQ